MEVRLAGSGGEGLVVFEGFRPHVVLLDIGLPDMGGYEVGRNLRTGNYSGILIAVTGYGQEGDRTSSAQAGFDDHLVKPVALETLKAAIEKRMRAALQDAVDSTTA
jgi:DNA-binding response OmpR family regulator